MMSLLEDQSRRKELNIWAVKRISGHGRQPPSPVLPFLPGLILGAPSTQG